MNEKEVKKVVREGYARVVEKSCCTSAVESADVCCQGVSLDEISKKIGYTDEDIAAVPEGSNLGLGCGNPVALSSLEKGDTVLDLGSGGGFDCFLAAKKVGEAGKVIGVDMTPEMLDRARENAEKGGYNNVEFRLGEIEHLPAGDNSVDVVISNCVINLSPDKGKVFQEVYRVLNPGGRMMISDMVLLKELPDVIKNTPEMYTGCVAGAVLKDEYIRFIKEAGFVNVTIVEEKSLPAEEMITDVTVKKLSEKVHIPLEKAAEILQSIVSIAVQGEKPA